jgi:uncharacterized protein (DUF1684 family)
MAFHRIGWVDVPFPGGTRRLAVYWLEGYAGGLFLPFRDATNGAETYSAGRYLLDAAKGADLGGPFEDAGGGPGGDAAGGAGWPTDSNEPTRRALILDFNFAYHPSCAFDPRWACPLAPPENRLDLAVRAGERIA